MSRQTKIKLTFQRKYKSSAAGQLYSLVVIENGVFAKTEDKTLYRVGDIVPEEAVEEFTLRKFVYDVKVKS